MFDMFRFPHTIIYIYRKRGFREAMQRAIQYAKQPVTDDDAAAWVRYVVSSPLYQRTEAHD